MDNTATNFESKSEKIEYSGKLEFKYKINGQVKNLHLKNSGTENLFKLLCKALCGYSLVDQIPSKLDIIGNNGSIIYNLIPFTGITYLQENNQWKVKLTATVLPSDITQTTISSDAELTLKMLNNLNEELATITDTSLATVLNTISAANGTAGVIEWSMTFANATSNG